jgi:superfamily II DNA or RNA helicase
VTALHPFQQEGVTAIGDAFRAGHRAVLFQLATGGGKTTVFSHIGARMVDNGRRVGVLVHRRELLDQARARLQVEGIDAAAIATRQEIDPAGLAHVASVQTLVKRLHMLPRDWFDLLVVDECHHTPAASWSQVLEHFSSARILGVSATPCRQDGTGLGQWYQELICGPSPQWLTDNKYLAPAEMFSPPGIDRGKIRQRMGEFIASEASGMMRSDSIIGDSLALYRKHLDGQTAVAFCCDVAHAEAVAQMFRDHGVPAAAIDGKMRRDPRAIPRILADLAGGTLRVVTSCDLIGEGTDIPSVGGALLLRPTQSVALHLQQIGRPLRYQPGKTAIIIDQVGNMIHGNHVWDQYGRDRVWSLEGSKRGRSKPPAPSVRVCPSCYSCLRSGTQRCHGCGYVWELWSRQLQHVPGELEAVTRPKPGSFASQRAAAQTYSELVAVGRSRGMARPHAWASHILAARKAKPKRRAG